MKKRPVFFGRKIVAALTTAVLAASALPAEAGAFELSSGSSSGDYAPTNVPKHDDKDPKDDHKKTPELPGSGHKDGIEISPVGTNPGGIEAPDDANGLPGSGEIDRQLVPLPENDPQRDLGETYTRGWEWLKTPNALVPGAYYWVKRQDGKWGFCSLGYLANWGKTLVGVTAGHCGIAGDEVYLSTVDQNGDQAVGAYVGRFLWSSQPNRMDGPVYHTPFDIAFFSIDRKVPMAASAFNRGVVGAPVTPYEASRIMQTLPDGRGWICKLGGTTGYSCGKFVAWDQEVPESFASWTNADHGDSGGPVYLYYNNQLHPIAVTSFGPEKSKFGQSFAIFHLLAKWGIRIYI